MPGVALDKGVLCREPATWHSAKAVALADPNPATWQAFAECLAVGKGGSFAECLTTGHSAKGTATDAVCLGPLCRVPLFAECQALDKDPLCRVLLFAESQTLGKEIFTECVVWHSANSLFAECPWFATRQILCHSAK